jgi:hypothetical protein
LVRSLALSTTAVKADKAIRIRLALCCSTLHTIGIARDEGLTTSATYIAALKSVPTDRFPVVQTTVEWNFARCWCWRCGSSSAPKEEEEEEEEEKEEEEEEEEEVEEEEEEDHHYIKIIK